MSWLKFVKNLFITSPNYTYFDDKITEKELEDALKNLNKKSAPGPDKISNKHLVNLSENGKNIVLGLINHSWVNGKILDDWKIAKISMLEKDPNDN